MIRVVLFDLDGVIRHFDPQHVADIEVEYELAAGTLEKIAFAKPLIEDVTSGRISRAEWVRQIGQEAGSAAAAEEWGSQSAAVDEDVLGLSDEIRILGLRTAVLTNGTDALPAELAAMGNWRTVRHDLQLGWCRVREARRSRLPPRARDARRSRGGGVLHR